MIENINNEIFKDIKINVRTFASVNMDANCYLVEINDEYIIIDPCVSYNKLARFINGDVKGIFITHGHFDHFECLDTYLNNIKDVNVYASKKCFEKIEDNIKNCSYFMNDIIEFFVDDSQKNIIKNSALEDVFKEIKIIVYETPGHSDCSLTFIINVLMFTGDFLFKNSIGRTDLYSGNFNNMEKSLKDLFLIEKNYIVYPGHGSYTTLNEEKLNNFYLKKYK